MTPSFITSLVGQRTMTSHEKELNKILDIKTMRPAYSSLMFNAIGRTCATIFVLLSILFISGSSWAGLITPTVGAPPAATAAYFNIGVKNPNMNDINPVASGGDGVPDDWSTNGPIQVGNTPHGSGVTTLEGGVISQSLNGAGAVPAPPAGPAGAPGGKVGYWIHLVYQTFPANIYGQSLIDPYLTVSMSYQDSPGSFRQDFFYIQGNNPNGVAAPGWATVDYWGWLASAPTKVDFSLSSYAVCGVNCAISKVDTVDFRVTSSTPSVPEPRDLLIFAIAVIGGCAFLLRDARIARHRNSSKQSSIVSTT